MGSGVVVLNPAAVDGYGNPISVTRDESVEVNRVMGSTIVENPVRISDNNQTSVADVQENSTGSNAGSATRLAVDVGSPTIILGQKLASDYEFQLIDFVRNSEGESSLIADGSSTPVAFTLDAEDGYDIEVTQLRIALTTQDITFDGASLGTRAAVTNGIRIDMIADDIYYNIITIRQNEDWLFFPSPSGMLLNNTGPKDVMVGDWFFPNLFYLRGGSDDRVQVLIQDDLTGGGSNEFNFFKCMVYGIRGPTDG